MNINFEEAKATIDALVIDNDSLRVELELALKELAKWKSMAMVMTADRECTVFTMNKPFIPAR